MGEQTYTYTNEEGETKEMYAPNPRGECDQVWVQEAHSCSEEWHPNHYGRQSHDGLCPDRFWEDCRIPSTHSPPTHRRGCRLGSWTSMHCHNPNKGVGHPDSQRGPKIRPRFYDEERGGIWRHPCLLPG